MGIDEIKPRQLAPSVGTGDADCAIVTVPSAAIYDSSAPAEQFCFGFLIASMARSHLVDSSVSSCSASTSTKSAKMHPVSTAIPTRQTCTIMKKKKKNDLD